MSNECLFCKIVNKEVPSSVIYENDHVLSFMDVFPNAEGHVLIIPKNHSIDFGDTPTSDIIEVAKAKKIVMKILKERLNPVGFNFISNMGSEAHQVIFHYHEHIVPKYKKEFGYSPSVKHDEDRDYKEIYEIITK